MEPTANYDVVIIGGGINGSGIAAEAAERGLSVCLCEQNDLASGTSSVSSKLIHGGLRYLEQYDFALVRKSLLEREILFRKAPHLIQPLQFIMPHSEKLRPYWFIRLGLYLYDHLARREFLPSSKALTLTDNDFGLPLKNIYLKGFSYYDCQTKDARLVIANAVAAKNHNARILTHHQVIEVQQHFDHWQVILEHKNDKKKITAKVLINASGPWLAKTNQLLQCHPAVSLSLVKGSHFVVPKLYPGDHAYILQTHDKRIIFTIPYEQAFTLIGTTEEIYSGDLTSVTIDENEIDYLCRVTNDYFKKQISAKDILWHYSGVRPLIKEGKSATTTSRDYHIDVQTTPLPLVNIIGGKLTTYRTLSQKTLEKIQHYFPHILASRSNVSILPGGDIPHHNLTEFVEQLSQQFPWLPKTIQQRYAENYGTLAYTWLDNARCLADLGENFSNGFYEAELDYLKHHEWAQTAEDVLWRRSKLGLYMDATATKAIDDWLA